MHSSCCHPVNDETQPNTWLRTEVSINDRLTKALPRFRFWWRPFLFLVVLCAGAAPSKASPPVLLNRANSTRAVALEALNFQREPFALTSSSLLGNQDQRTRIMLFAVNLSGATPSMVTVDAEDGSHRHYNFKVEYVGPLQGGEALGISQLTVRLSDDLTVVGDVLVQISFGGAVSNRLRVGIGYVGDGLPDDFIKISGRIGTNVSGLAGVLVMLTGTINEPTVTDLSGFYSFTNVVQGGNYEVTASRINYTLSPQKHNLPFLVADQVANFSATPVNFTISGRITDNNNPLVGIGIALTGSQSATTTTDGNGNYSLSAAAEGNYLVTASSPVYTFGPSSGFFNNLGSNQTLNFAVTSRPTYSISGYVKKPDGSALPGTTLTLSGSQASTVITDAAGFYGFANILAAGNYSVTASKVGYAVSPSTQDFANLSANQTVNFTASPLSYTIGGRITDGTGAGVANVSVMLSGSQSATIPTDANGNYAFTVPSLGNYAVTPSSNFNSFTPAIQTFDNLGGNRTANFAATELTGFYVLDFDGTPKTVDYGDFFQLQPGQTQLGKFFWEFWAKPGANAYARYMLSDGFGGAHALLCGFVGDSGTRYGLYGNVWNGVTAIDFGSDDGPAPFEWGHMAVGWDGNYIYSYFDGVPVGIKPFSGPRLPAGGDNGGGRLFIGGSDHNNFDGRIEQVRGFENVNPRDNGLQTVTFRPDNLFGITPGTFVGPRSTFLTNFLRPMLTVPDFAGGRVGILRAGWPVTNPVSTYPLPQFVIDPEAPNTSPVTGPRPPDGKIDIPAPVPDNAIIFDSFSRRTSTYAFNGRGGLGSTEGGSAGIKKWKTALVPGGGTNEFYEPFGLINGRVVPLSDFNLAFVAWVDTGYTDGTLTVSTRRTPRFWRSGMDTSLAFRVVDSENFFFTYTYGDMLNANARKLIVGYWLNGQRTYLALNIDLPADWNKLTVVTAKTGLIQVYASERLVYSTNSSILANAGGAGLYSGNNALANRWDDFTVFLEP